MDSLLPPLQPLNITSASIYSDWVDWKGNFELYQNGSGLKDKDEKVQLSAMLYMMGTGAHKIFQMMTFPEGKQKDKLKDVIEQFDLHFKGKASKSSLRQTFKNRVQKSGESLIDYVESVQQLAITAGYKLEDTEVTDTITRGILNRTVQAKLLDLGDDITIEKCIKICRSAQLTSDYFKSRDSEPTNPSSVSQTSSVNYAGVQGARPNNTKPQGNSAVKGPQPGSTKLDPCRNCGLSHFKGQCPAFGKICAACSKKNHFARVCRSKPNNQPYHPGRGNPPFRGNNPPFRGNNQSFRGKPFPYNQNRNVNYMDQYSTQYYPGNSGFVPQTEYVQQMGQVSRQSEYMPSESGYAASASGYNPSPQGYTPSASAYTVQNITDDLSEFFVNTLDADTQDVTDIQQYTVTPDVTLADVALDVTVAKDTYAEPTISDSQESATLDIGEIPDIFINSVETVNTVDSDWNVDVQIASKTVKLKIDTGAQCNVISLKTYQSLGIQHCLQQSNVTIRAFGGNRLKAIGQVTVTVSYKNKARNVTFQVIDAPVQNILGSQDSELMGFVYRVNQLGNTQNLINGDPIEIIKQYPDRFKGLGCIKKPYEIKVRKDVEPVVHAPRAVPAAIKSKLKAKLDEGEKLGLWEKVSEPTEWVNSAVTVNKADDIRLCLDPRDLNKAVMREHYPMNTLENVMTKCHSSTTFTVLDLNQGFYQIPLTKNCRNLTCFNTPFGRYRYCRLPMGICSAPEVFQRSMEEIFGDISGVEINMDDLLVHDTPDKPGLQGHNKNLIQVMERARENNVTFKIKKLRVGRDEVGFTGHTWTPEGIKVSEEKIKAIKEMPTPTSKDELWTQLGLMNYLSKYIPHFSEIAAPLRDLVKQNVEWSWQPLHDRKLAELKKLITEAPVLKYYSPNEPIVVSVDASAKGLGAVLMQDNRPVAYASKALTPTEQRYAQIEKETLAIVFGMDKFKNMVYGRKDVTVETDHKPLENIFKKPLHQVPMRIQKMMLKLQPYEFTVVWKPGKQIPVADALSRYYLPEYGKKLMNDDEMVCQCITEIIPFSQPRQKQLREETAKDSVLVKLSDIIMNGWPENKHELPACIHPYWEYRDELTVYDGVVFRGDRVVIPQAMRPEMLRIIHEGHFGIVLCKRRARDVLFWPGINAQIQDMISKCATCLEMRNSQQKEPLIPHDVPDLPWRKVATDLFEVEGDHYLITADYFSEFFEIDDLGQSTKGQKVIKSLKAHFARHGIPDILISDNGPPYSSDEFKDFTQKWNIKHDTSSPTFAQSNGFAEKNVQIAKRIILKCRKDKGDMYLALLDYRNTPRDDIVGSPVQRLMGRRTQTLLPTSNVLLRPQVMDPEKVQARLMEYKMKQKQYYDQGARELPPLKPGDVIRMQTKQGWLPGVVIDNDPRPRSHIVEIPETGGIYRRNRRHLLKTAENPPMTPPWGMSNIPQSPVIHGQTPVHPMVLRSQQPPVPPTGLQPPWGMSNIPQSPVIHGQTPVHPMVLRSQQPPVPPTGLQPPVGNPTPMLARAHPPPVSPMNSKVTLSPVPQGQNTPTLGPQTIQAHGPPRPLPNTPVRAAPVAVPATMLPRTPPRVLPGTVLNGNQLPK